MYAIKTIKKSESLEVELLKQLDHPNIIKVYEVIEDSEHLSIVTELCTGGNLYQRLLSDKVTEEFAADVIRQLVSCLVYCHGLNIVHRDLKLENILFEDTESSVIKLIDFGVSARMTQHKPLTRSIGTIYYMSPEVIKGEYDEK